MNDKEQAKRESESVPDQPAAAVEAPPPQQAAGAEPVVAGRERQRTAARSGLVVGTIALLLALGAGVAAYLVWQELQAIRAGQQQDATRLATRADDLQRDVRQLSETLTADLAGVRRQQEAQQEALTALRAATQRGQDEWIIAEVEYLLRIANDRLQLQRDVGTAVAALITADQRLRELGNPALLAVREQLAREITALRAAVEPDIPGLSLVLNSLAERVDQLPLSLQYHGGRGQAPAAVDAAAPAVDPISDWRAFLRAVWEDLKSLVVIRHNKEAVGAMLPPEQEFFLRQNLRLKLETAQLAALQRNEAAYRSNLQSARQLVTTYFDQDSGAVTALLAELDRLEQAQINPELPDISGSLRALREAVSALPGRDEGRAESGAGQP